MHTSIRLRDFIEDKDGWLYAVSTYDNQERVGCILRYIPDHAGERTDIRGRKYHKLDFDEAFRIINSEKPSYQDTVHRIPHKDIVKVYKPEEEIASIIRRNALVKKLMAIFNLPHQTYGCTGSYLCGLENAQSDVDMVVYGNEWFVAQKLLQIAVAEGRLSPVSDETWQYIYAKRNPELSFEDFIIHEQRKWNRGQIGETYFDLLYTRPYDALHPLPMKKGEVIGRMKVQALVTSASLSHDNPAEYIVDHELISRVLSFTHTYSGQALAGEIIEAQGVCERHGNEYWLIIGTSREARGEYIKSVSLLECRELQENATCFEA